MILDLRGFDAPNVDDLPFSVSSFYNRGLTIGDITDRPRKVYHQWKYEGLIPAHFGKDYWMCYQQELGINLEEPVWERFNFVEAAWIKIVDILRSFNYPKPLIKDMAAIYFSMDEEMKNEYKKILREYKSHVGTKLEGLLKGYGLAVPAEKAHKQLRDISASFTMGRFDQLTLQSINERVPLTFIVPMGGKLIPVIEGEQFENPKHAAFIEEIKSKPHLIIPYYKMLEEMLFDKEYAHYAKVITGLNTAESKVIKAIREKKVKEITVNKSDDRQKMILRQTERQIISREDETKLIRLLTDKKYKVLNTSHLEGGRILIDLELKETIQAYD